MNYFLLKNYKLLLYLIFIYLLLSIFRNFFNFYFFLIISIIIIYLYKKNKRLFKKTVYKIFFKNKKNYAFRNKYVAAIDSLKSLEKINNEIKNKVDAELLLYEKNKLSEQLKNGDYNVTLFGAGSSGKTSIARALLKNLIGKTSPTMGTTKDITS